ncbi:hypothetical protein BMS3Abin04_01991 [bacterium BMS3Abin04]|nr:hypothetical protein BMS3Abin04_01991 [bacterium BMS3Abin04]
MSPCAETLSLIEKPNAPILGLRLIVKAKINEDTSEAKPVPLLNKSLNFSLSFASKYFPTVSPKEFCSPEKK